MSWGFPEYVPVAQKKADAQAQLAKLRKKNPGVDPIVVEGNKLAKNWWGIAWNKNLENYADYANRIGRGRSYLRNGCVIDLRIATGRVDALVAGSRKTPYRIAVTIVPLPDPQWRKIVAACSRKIAGIEQLVAGQFPKELEALFVAKGEGLFPSSKEIDFDCSCPDWAQLCKHVAAVLYGIGAKFDDDPLLFFKLRGIDFEVLLRKSVREKMQSMLKNADRKTARVLDDTDISGLFGI